MTGILVQVRGVVPDVSRGTRQGSDIVLGVGIGE